MTVRLSENFTLRELLWSDEAARDEALIREQLNPPEGIVENLRYLARTVLQPLRDEIGWPIRVSSGYRCLTLNRRIKSSDTSQHVQGEAADISIADPDGFLSSPDTAAVRATCQLLYRNATGAPFPAVHNANFYLFVLIALDMDIWDIDQVIHEFGPTWGQPAWIHAASSVRQDSRRISVVGDFTQGKYLHCDQLSAAAAKWQETV